MTDGRQVHSVDTIAKDIRRFQASILPRTDYAVQGSTLSAAMLDLKNEVIRGQDFYQKNVLCMYSSPYIYDKKISDSRLQPSGFHWRYDI